MIDIENNKKISITVDELKNLFSNFFIADFIILHRSLWAVSLKVDKKFIKIYYFDNFKKIKKEIELLNLLNNNKTELLYNKEYEFYYSITDYLCLKKINSETEITWLQNKIDNVFSEFKKIEIELPSFCKTKEYICNRINLCMSYFDIDKNINYVTNLRDEHFIHGDFNLSNILLYDDNIYVLDFENSVIGPYNWDEVSFVYSLLEDDNNYMAKFFIQKYDIDKLMLESFAMYKLGISIAKKIDISKRFNILLDIKYKS